MVDEVSNLAKTKKIPETRHFQPFQSSTTIIANNISNFIKNE